MIFWHAKLIQRKQKLGGGFWNKKIDMEKTLLKWSYAVAIVLGVHLIPILSRVTDFEPFTLVDVSKLALFYPLNDSNVFNMAPSFDAAVPRYG